MLVGFVVALCLFGLVLPLLEPYPDSSAPLAAVVGGLAAVSLGCVVASRLVGSLDCTDHRALLNSYQNRFFMRIAVVEGGALVAYAAVFVVGRPWLYLVGAVPALVGFYWAAPSRRNLERDQEQLNSSGCGRSLLAVLQTPPEPLSPDA